MTVNKGLSSLIDISPNFSNQALENAVNEIKAVDQDDGYQFIKSQFDVDTAIRTNNVLSTSQKNDALETLNAAQPHLQIGRILTDVVRHTASIIDGSILPVDGVAGTFTEILGHVSALDGLIPFFYGVPASEKKRGVNDHLGTLNNIFLETEDSRAPVLTRLKELMQRIDTTARINGTLATETAAVRSSNTQLITFLTTIRDDSTDFQETLDNRVNQAAGNYSSLNTRIGDALQGDVIEELVSIKDEITNQVTLENTNLFGIRTYLQSLVDVQTYTGLANNKEMADLLAKVAQAPKWVTYYEDYSNNLSNINPIFNTNTDSDKSAIIDQVLADSGLPDVTDSTDFDAVADKARRDSRINTSGYDRLTVEAQITKSCEQLGITTSNRTINSQSVSLLNNMNKHDRDEIATRLDLNESSNTYS